LSSLLSIWRNLHFPIFNNFPPDYESGRAGLGGLANGSTGGSEWTAFIGGGYDFHVGQLTAGPIASLQYTDVGIDSFDEKDSLAPLDIHSGSAESLRSEVGFGTLYHCQIGKILVEPSIKAAWEHQYKYSVSGSAFSR
jgi:outer membrane autotransporter protein